MARWLPQLRPLLPLADDELLLVVAYAQQLPSKAAVAAHFDGLVGDSPAAVAFVADFVEARGAAADDEPLPPKPGLDPVVPVQSPSSSSSLLPPALVDMGTDHADAPDGDPPSAFSSVPPPAYSATEGATPVYSVNPQHSNALIRASAVRARDEQEMQQALQTLQYQVGIYNPEIEPEHESDYFCGCAVHRYQRLKFNRLPVQDMWSKAVLYPGERAYTAVTYAGTTPLFTRNPYVLSCGSPFGYVWGGGNLFGPSKPTPSAHESWIMQVIALSNRLNGQAQARVNALEPAANIWDMAPPAVASTDAVSVDGGDGVGGGGGRGDAGQGRKGESRRESRESRGGRGEGKTGGKGSSNGFFSRASAAQSEPSAPAADASASDKPKSRFAGFKKSLGIKTTEEKADEFAASLRTSILAEEAGRWPDVATRQIVAAYQDKVGMATHIATMRARQPLQYLHLLRAGYFEPIPVAWARLASNPLKFSVDAREGWRGVTPAWRGYEDLAEERLYWVLNHRTSTAAPGGAGGAGGANGAPVRMKPDFVSEMRMAQSRMATAVEPPPVYYAPDDTCMAQHTSAHHAYSKQVMPAPFHAVDRPETPADDTMILLDVSGSMNFDPVRPVYNRYLITSYARSTQPKNKDVAKAIIRRFTEALAHHDQGMAAHAGHAGPEGNGRTARGYDLVTFSDRAAYVGTLRHGNFDAVWQRVRVGGGTRVMAGWQLVKERHFQKHQASAVHHPVFGWQAGPDTPILRLLLFLDGEATDMDEFELDLLGLAWAHVTIFLIGVDMCPHHHRHANELQRISDVNPHVSFVDAQGNCPERFVTHELLKRHLGYNVSLREFEEMEHPPAYRAVA